MVWRMGPQKNIKNEYKIQFQKPLGMSEHSEIL